MTLETVGTITTALLVIISRIMSNLEHRKTEKNVKKNDTKLNDVYILVNSRMDELLRAAREEGRRDAEKNS